MAELAELFLWSLAAAVVWQSMVFLLATRLGRVDVIDVGWGLTFIVIALTLMYLQQPVRSVGVVVVVMVSVWGARLAWHIGRRFARSSTQDPRYTALVRQYSPRTYWLQVYGRIYIVQAVLATIVSLPVMAVMLMRPDWNVWVWTGLTVWAVGFACEVVADAQLKKFLRTAKKNDLMTQGLWRYSRHPNYFGEMVLWWGLAVMSFGGQYWWAAILGALVISGLLRFVSGVPPAEARAASKRGWQRYKNTTPVLVPWPPKSVNHDR